MEERSIYSYIEEKGINDAKEILQRGKEKAEALEEEILNEAKKEVNSILNNARKSSDDLKRTTLTQSEQKFRQRSLNVKKNLLNEVFQKALVKLNGLNDNQYKDLIIGLLKKEQLSGNETIMVSTNDFSRYVELFNGKKNDSGDIVLEGLSKHLGQSFAIKLSSEWANIKGGLIVIRDDYDLDLSFESLLTDVRDNYEPEIANMLFKEVK